MKQQVKAKVLDDKALRLSASSFRQQILCLYVNLPCKQSHKKRLFWILKFYMCIIYDKCIYIIRPIPILELLMLNSFKQKNRNVLFLMRIFYSVQHLICILLFVTLFNGFQGLLRGSYKHPCVYYEDCVQVKNL